MTRLREYLSSALRGAWFAVYLTALVSAVGWWLYAPGLISADSFVWLLRFSIGGALGATLGMPLTVALMWLSDRRRS